MGGKQTDRQTCQILEDDAIVMRVGSGGQTYPHLPPGPSRLGMTEVQDSGLGC